MKYMINCYSCYRKIKKINILLKKYCNYHFCNDCVLNWLINCKDSYH